MVLAHQFALESPLIESEAVDAMEFMDLAFRFEVNGVPHTSINENSGAVIGAAPEERLLFEIERALKISSAK